MVKQSKTAAVLVILGLAAFLLSGCVYSGEVKRQGAPATGEYISVVQNGIDQYRAKTGVLPIKNKEQDTPVYEKYLIDFKKMIETRAISAIPVNAFENGGTAVYVLINPETKPEVKLMDLPAYQKIVQLQKEVDDYKGKHGKLPEGAEIAPHFRTVDFGKLGRKEEQIPSPYSRTFLAVILDDTGRVGIDYGPEVAKAMAKKGVKNAEASVDLRSYLVEEGIFVPARSFPYRWQNDVPALSQQ